MTPMGGPPNANTTGFRNRVMLVTRFLYGVFTYLAYLARYRNGYVAENAFYRAAQDGHRGPLALLTSAPARLFVDYAFAVDAATRDRIPPPVAATYADETLGGYGAADFDLGTPLEEQQRGLLSSRLERAHLGGLRSDRRHHGLLAAPPRGRVASQLLGLSRRSGVQNEGVAFLPIHEPAITQARHLGLCRERGIVLALFRASF